MRTVLILLAALAGAAPALADAPAPAADCRYDVLLRADLRLSARVRCPPRVDGFAAVNGAAGRYLSLTLERRADATVGRYDIDLAAFARGENSINSAAGNGRSVIAPGASWLLRPQGLDDAELAVTVRREAGVGFATGLARRGDSYRLRSRDLPYAGFSVFGAFDHRTLDVRRTDGAAGTVDLAVMDGDLAVPRPARDAWIDDSLRAGLDFWRGLPADHLLLAILPRPGRRGVPFGRVMSGGGPTMVVFVGALADAAALADDWVFIHELIHVGTPFARGGMWFMEGQATYFEPLIRVRWRRQTEAQMWHEFVTNMPRSARLIEATGLASSGFRGMYYGGAILMLLADVEVRRASRGQRGLEDCFRGLQRVDGNAARRTTLAALVAACDRELGAPVMKAVVDRYGYAANPVDLDGLWQQLGVVRDGDAVTLDDGAPWAWVRRALVKGGA
ncbi:MAG: hypothetical protein H6906_10295 [Hyphomicrobiales bacterium]|nr:hypothetical protein [Hyphomicrobiales bacterium]